jgi:CheY-like chemotaxis protein
VSKDAPLDGLTLMIVDDDDAAATDLIELAGRLGAEATRWTGSDLVRHLRSHFVHVVVVAAEGDGEGLVRADTLREQAELRNIRVVIGTAQISRESLARHAHTVTGADAYLRKPWDEARTEACLLRLQQGAPGIDERLWWLDDRSDPPPEPSGASGPGSGSPIGIPGFKP